MDANINMYFCISGYALHVNLHTNMHVHVYT